MMEKLNEKFKRLLQNSIWGKYSKKKENYYEAYDYIVQDVSSLYPTIMAKSINQLCEEAYEIAKSKGWHDEPREMGTMLALIMSEVAEALEADRKGDSENFIEELADVCIRIFDLCGSMNLDLNSAIESKMQVNRLRSYKHGKRY